MRIVLRTVTVSALLLVTACGSSPATTLLTLDAVTPPPGAVHADYRGPVIVIPAVHVPAVIDRTEFVHEVTAGSGKVDDLAHWAAPLGLLSRDALVRDLIARLPEGKVLPPGTTAPGKGASVIDVTILGFATTPNGATMQIAWRVLPDGATRQVSVNVEQPISTPPTAATAYAALIAALAESISGELSSGSDKELQP